MISLQNQGKIEDLEVLLHKYTNKLGATRDPKSKWVFTNTNIPMLWEAVLSYTENGTNNRPLLELYGQFRKEMVDAVLRHAVQQVGNCDTCEAVSVGSVTPTSDYDITVSGPKSAQVVKAFNNVFQDLFGGTESGDIFDTNLYGAGFYEQCEAAQGHFKKFRGNRCYVDTSGNATAIVDQRVWAFVKLDMYLTPQNRKFLLQNLTPQPRQHYNDAIRLRKQLDSVVINNRPFDRLDLKSMNRLYEKSLMDVQVRKRQMQQGETSTPEGTIERKYKNAISTANYYGSETYFTQGAFMHVVGQLQSNISDIPITSHEYLDSFIENMGDALKELSHYEHQLGNDDVCGKLIIKVSKYISRTMDALTKSFGKSKYYKKQRKLSETIRTDLRGKRQSADCPPSDPSCVSLEAAERLQDEFLNKFGLKECGDMRDRFLSMVVKVVNKFYAEKMLPPAFD